MTSITSKNLNFLLFINMLFNTTFTSIAAFNMPSIFNINKTKKEKFSNSRKALIYSSIIITGIAIIIFIKKYNCENPSIHEQTFEEKARNLELMIDFHKNYSKKITPIFIIGQDNNKKKILKDLIINKTKRPTLYIKTLKEIVKLPETLEELCKKNEAHTIVIENVETFSKMRAPIAMLPHLNFVIKRYSGNNKFLFALDSTKYIPYVMEKNNYDTILI